MMQKNVVLFVLWDYWIFFKRLKCIVLVDQDAIHMQILHISLPLIKAYTIHVFMYLISNDNKRNISKIGESGEMNLNSTHFFRWKRKKTKRSYSYWNIISARMVGISTTRWNTLFEWHLWTTTKAYSERLIVELAWDSWPSSRENKNLVTLGPILSYYDPKKELTLHMIFLRRDWVRQFY